MLAVHFLVAAAGLSLAMAFAWLIQRRTGKSGWIDAVWSFATAGVGGALALAPSSAANWPSARAMLIAAMVLAWGIRLGSHIAARTIGGGEDPRYADLARQWGAAFPRRLFWFLQIQAACSLALVISVFAAARNPAPFPNFLDGLGVFVFCASIAGETIADRQLQAFRRRPQNKGRVCDTGLWGMSRHPNYFFECAMWTSYLCISINISGDYPWGFAALAGPVLMYWLLAHVSGVPPLEASMSRSRGAAFAAYQARVNTFFPGPQRKPRADDIRSAAP